MLVPDWSTHLIDAVPEHRVALATASLPVGEEGGVEAFPGVIQHTASQVIEHLERKDDFRTFPNDL